MQTIVYKGMLRSVVLGAFFKDLSDPAFDTAFVIYHRRFSTNTNPKWPLAQPMRVLGHNGEINTVQVRPPVACGDAVAVHVLGLVLACVSANMQSPCVLVDVTSVPA